MYRVTITSGLRFTIYKILILCADYMEDFFSLFPIMNYPFKPESSFKRKENRE